MDAIEQIQAALSRAGWASQIKIGGDPLCQFTMSTELPGRYPVTITGSGDTEEAAVADGLGQLAAQYLQTRLMLAQQEKET